MVWRVKNIYHKKWKESQFYNDYQQFRNIRPQCKNLYAGCYENQVNNVQSNIVNKTKNFELPSWMTSKNYKTEDPPSIIDDSSSRHSMIAG